MNNHNTPYILIVDDDEITILLIESLLESQGYKLDSARSGQEALLKVKKNYYDLIISDLVMPHMDGNKLVRSIRSMPEYSNIPFIFISGKKEEDIWVKNLKDGADDYLLKPVNKEIFISKIKILLNRSLRNKKSISTFQRQILEPEKGSIIYCNSPLNKYSLDNSKINNNIFPVYDEKKLFAKLGSENIWAILIDETAAWAIKVLEKLINYTNKSFPIYFLLSENTSENSIENLYNKDINGHILKYKQHSLTVKEINARLSRELELKTKYLHALNQAANKSPFNCKPKFTYENEKITIDIRHKCFNNIPGGDYYELYSTNDGDNLTIIGDVMGKSWGAWFIQPAYIAYLKSIILFNTNFLNKENITNPQNILKKLNTFIYNDKSLSDVFATISIIGYTNNDNTLHISSAGALRPLYFNNKENEIQQLNITGTVLGVLPEVEYMKMDIKLSEKDKLLFYTDGYTEAKGRESNKMTGHKPLEIIFMNHSSNDKISTKQIEETLVVEENISTFDDDRTMLLVKCKKE